MIVRSTFLRPASDVESLVGSIASPIIEILAVPPRDESTIDIKRGGGAVGKNLPCKRRGRREKDRNTVEGRKR